LLCGLPLLCTNYSCGTDFCDKSFVFPLDGDHYFEVGTGFQKHNPNLQTIVSFYRSIIDMTPEVRKEITEAGRKWALETFHVDTLGKKMEAWIDSRKLIDWDYTYPVDPKNPNAVIPDIQDNSQWLIVLYKNILNMTVDDKDPGHLSWMQGLQQGRKRHDIEKFFRDTASQENNKNPETQLKFEDLLDKTGRPRFLLVIKESIGDIINSSSLLKSLKEHYKDYDIYVASDPQYLEIWDGNPYIRKALVYQSFMESEPQCTGIAGNKGFFDGYCHLGVITQRHLSYLTNSSLALELT
jgi:hypothetical protein